jgi:hypothetical protein
MAFSTREVVRRLSGTAALAGLVGALCTVGISFARESGDSPSIPTDGTCAYTSVQAGEGYTFYGGDRGLSFRLAESVDNPYAGFGEPHMVAPGEQYTLMPSAARTIILSCMPTN